MLLQGHVRRFGSSNFPVASAVVSSLLLLPVSSHPQPCLTLIYAATLCVSVWVMLPTPPRACICCFVLAPLHRYVGWNVCSDASYGAPCYQSCTPHQFPASLSTHGFSSLELHASSCSFIFVCFLPLLSLCCDPAVLLCFCVVLLPLAFTHQLPVPTSSPVL